MIANAAMRDLIRARSGSVKSVSDRNGDFDRILSDGWVLVAGGAAVLARLAPSSVPNLSDGLAIQEWEYRVNDVGLYPAMVGNQSRYATACLELGWKFAVAARRAGKGVLDGIQMHALVSICVDLDDLDQVGQPVTIRFFHGRPMIDWMSDLEAFKSNAIGIWNLESR